MWIEDERIVFQDPVARSQAGPTRELDAVYMPSVITADAATSGSLAHIRAPVMISDSGSQHQARNTSLVPE